MIIHLLWPFLECRIDASRSMSSELINLLGMSRTENDYSAII